VGCSLYLILDRSELALFIDIDIVHYQFCCTDRELILRAIFMKHLREKLKLRESFGTQNYNKAKECFKF